MTQAKTPAAVMARTTLKRVNDASDAIDEAENFAFAIEFAVEAVGGATPQLSGAVAACCNRIILLIIEAKGLLEQVAEDERNKEAAE